MNYTVKKHSKEEFYPIYEKWLTDHGFPIINEKICPENFFVCYKDDYPIYAMPFWHTDSKVCIIAFVASNKNVNYKRKIGGLDFLIGQMCNYAKRKNYLSVYTTTTTQSVIDSLIKNEFTHGDLDSSQFFKTL